MSTRRETAGVPGRRPEDAIRPLPARGEYMPVPLRRPWSVAVTVTPSRKLGSSADSEVRVMFFPPEV